MKRLAIVTTHPIQYNAPLFRLLAQSGNLQIKVFYTWEQSRQGTKFDPGFGKTVTWDIPLLDGYEYEFVTNSAKNPGSHHFWGVQTPNLNQEIVNWAADAVLVYGWNFASHLACLRYFKGKIPVYFRGDSHLINEFPLWRKVSRKLLLRWVYKYIDYAFYVGTANREYFLNAGLSKEQLIFVPHAVDNKRFFDETGDYQAEATSLRKELRIPPEATTLLYAGKFEPVKDLLTLAEAFLNISTANLHLLLVGNGPLEGALKKRLKDHSNVRFLEFQNQRRMPVIYRLGDVFVLPSRSETWGLSINESMASSRAVLVSNKCGCSIDLVKEATNGYIFQAGNVQDLTEKIRTFSRLSRKNLLDLGKCGEVNIRPWSYETNLKAISSALNNESLGVINTWK